MKSVACVLLLAAAALAAPGYLHGGWSPGLELGHEHEGLELESYSAPAHVVSVDKIVSVPKVVEVKKIVSVPQVVSVPRVVKVAALVEDHSGGSSGWW